MKKTATIFLLALIVGGFLASSAHALASYGGDCTQCHSFSNKPPVANAGADRTVAAGAAGTLNGAASSDPDDGIASYAWKETAGTTVAITGANTVAARFTAPNVTTSTVLTFQLTVTDRRPQSATDTINVTVTPASTNQPPVANAGPDQTVAAGTGVTLSGAASTDPDDGIASYAWSQTTGPGVSLSSSTAVSPTFTAPTVTTETTLAFSLTVTDKSGAKSAADTVSVAVNPSGSTTNLPPTASAGLDLTVLPRSFNVLDGFYSSDPDDGIASYSWTQTGGPAVKLSNPAAMDPTFRAPSGPATLTFSLAVTDRGGLRSSDTVTVLVLAPNGGLPPPPPVNQPPVADAGADRRVRSGSAVGLSGNASTDPENTIASYQWRQISGISVSLSGAASANVSFVAPQVSSGGVSLIFELTVTDEGGLTSSDRVTVSVYRSEDDDDDDDDDDD